MRSVIVNVCRAIEEEELTILVADIINAAYAVFTDLEVELDADENENIIVNVKEYTP